jgi:hypothetical protein
MCVIFIGMEGVVHMFPLYFPPYQSGNVILFIVSPYSSIGLKLSMQIASLSGSPHSTNVSPL